MCARWLGGRLAGPRVGGAAPGALLTTAPGALAAPSFPAPPRARPARSTASQSPSPAGSDGTPLRGGAGNVAVLGRCRTVGTPEREKGVTGVEAAPARGGGARAARLPRGNGALGPAPSVERLGGPGVVAAAKWWRMQGPRVREGD